MRGLGIETALRCTKFIFQRISTFFAPQPTTSPPLRNRARILRTQNVRDACGEVDRIALGRIDDCLPECTGAAIVRVDYSKARGLHGSHMEKQGCSDHREKQNAVLDFAAIPRTWVIGRLTIVHRELKVFWWSGRSSCFLARGQSFCA